MISVNMLEAKTNLSKYVAYVSEKKEPFIVILRNGVPAAKIVPYEEDTSLRIGAAKGKLPDMPSLEDFNSIDTEDDFTGEGSLL